MSEKNNTILIRSLDEKQFQNLEVYKKRHSHKTNSKAVLAMIERILLLEADLEFALQNKQDVEIELQELKNDVYHFSEAFKKLYNK